MCVSPRIAWLLGFCVALLYLAPLAIPLPPTNGRPVHIMPSEILSLAILPLMLVRRLPRIGVIAGVLAILLLAIAAIGSLEDGGEHAPLLSAARFCLPMASTFTGIALGKIVKDGVGTAFGWAGAVVVLSVFATDAAGDAFPRGLSYEGRWGGWLGPFPAFGFPNASTTFLLLGSGSALLGMAVRSRSKRNRAVGLVGVGMAVLLAPLSLSRSAALAAFVLAATLFTAACIARRWLAVATCVGALLVVVSVESVAEAWLSDLGARHSLLVQRGDPTNARSTIWASVAAQIAESPALGLRFRFVSTGTGHVSTHNQYLEWLYKAGVVGTASIVTFWAAGVQMLFRHAGRQRMRVRSACFAACVGVVLAVVASAMFQSILTYAPMANLCFLVCGLLATRFGYPNDAGHGRLASVATVREAA